MEHIAGLDHQRRSLPPTAAHPQAATTRGAWADWFALAVLYAVSAASLVGFATFCRLATYHASPPGGQALGA